MNEWKTYKFGDLADLRKEQVNSNGAEQLYIGLEHIEQKTLRLNGIGSSNDVISNKFKFYAGDVLYGRLRPYFRKVFMPKFDGVCSTEIFVLKNKKIIDKSFLYYLVASEEFTNIANSGSSGTHMPRADWRQLVKSEWSIPSDIEIQTQIAQILTSLDDKIELNLQMNQTLEAMAQAIFKEWFVDFNFPGFHGEFVDGLPKGWRIGKLKEIVCFIVDNRGKTPITISEEEGNYPLIEVNSLINSQVVTQQHLAKKFVDEEAYNTWFRKGHPQKGDVLFSTVGSIGSVSLVFDEKFCIAQNIIALRSIFKGYFLFFTLKHLKQTLLSLDISSVQPSIKVPHLLNSEILIPDYNTVKSYEESILPLIDKINENSIQIQTLTQTRDSLLPRLMSGKIEVKS